MVAVNLSESKKTPENLGKNSGGSRPDEGKALLFVTEVEVDEESVLVKFEILAHEIPENKNRKFQDYFSLTGKFVDKTLDLAYATGVLDPDYFAQQQASGVDCDIDFESMAGKTVCTTIGHFTNKKNKTYAQSGWDLVDPNSEDGKNYPRVADEGGEAPAKDAATPPAADKTPF